MSFCFEALFLPMISLFLMIGYPQGHFEQAAPVVSAASATAPIQAQPVLPMPPQGPQAPNYAPPPFLVPPPQFIPPQTAPPNIINYVPTPNVQPPFPPNYQGYQGYTPAPPAVPVSIDIFLRDARKT